MSAPGKLVVVAASRKPASMQTVRTFKLPLMIVLFSQTSNNAVVVPIEPMVSRWAWLPASQKKEASAKEVRPRRKGDALVP
jgi:hypothetical protein